MGAAMFATLTDFRGFVLSLFYTFYLELEDSPKSFFMANVYSRSWVRKLVTINQLD